VLAEPGFAHHAPDVIGDCKSGQRLRVIFVFQRRPMLAVAAIAACVGIGMSLGASQIAPHAEPKSAAVAQGSPAFVGVHACGECHQDELNRWQGSHHQVAMQPAKEASVRGNFKNARFSNAGVTSTFFRRDDKFMARTDGPDGALHDFEIKFTFGVYPLQQYLIAMPGGRLQALGIAWDSRSLESGGQHWFSLYPNRKLLASDPLHWTGIDQTWNYMCADCHSTNVRKNYDLKTRTYATTYAEIDVACEACHGPGSNHVAWAKKQGDWTKFRADEGITIALDDRKGVAWTIDPGSGNPRRSVPRVSEREMQMCARCHARRGQIHEDYVHGQLADDDYRVALLDGGLYFPDGQIKDEVYEYGSFIQSRMYHAGVTCSDCHEPHSLTLRADGNNLCLQCHSADKYDSPRHHFHQVGTAGARCVACHMPTRTYMIVHARHDHSLRVPRPDLTLRIGTPNACNQCHADRSAQWASDSVLKWYGHIPGGFQRYADALRAGAEGSPGAQHALGLLAADREQPLIARATALALLAAYVPSPADAAVRSGVADDSPLVRRSAASALSHSDPAASASVLAPLLHDAVRSVRLETAEVLSSASATFVPSVDAAERDALNEYIQTQELNSDRPEAHLNLGLVYARQNHFPKAGAELKTALSLDPTFAPAAVNLADLYREQNRDADGERVLRTAIGLSPNDASLRYALGLLMVRKKRNGQALTLLGEAARIDPDNARYAYVYAVALNDAGQTGAAIETLERSISTHPYDRDTLVALEAFTEQSGQTAKAREYARRLSDLQPEDPRVLEMMKRFREQP
jgi:predicted CXXCH cytochrome family protein